MAKKIATTELAAAFAAVWTHATSVAGPAAPGHWYLVVRPASTPFASWLRSHAGGRGGSGWVEVACPATLDAAGAAAVLRTHGISAIPKARVTA